MAKKKDRHSHNPALSPVEAMYYDKINPLGLVA